MERRLFVQSVLGAGVATPYLRAQAAAEWGSPVLNTHLHLRKEADGCFGLRRDARDPADPRPR